MVNFWYNRVINGLATIDDVPLLWREKVREMLEEDAK